MDKMSYTHVMHTFEPVYDSQCTILILGSFPSVKSRENQFYYGHPQNRFWKMLAAVFDETVPESIEQKKSILLNHHLAVWDVIQSCDIEGSSDSSIKNVVVNDLDIIIKKSCVQNILLNGGKAFELYKKYCKRDGMPPEIKMPSTSPANAGCSLDKLIQIWRQELQ